MKLLYVLVLLLCWGPARGQQADSIVLSNAVLYYYSYGAGQPLIILSGGPGVASHQEDDVALELGKHYRTILFDQRGTGKSWTKPLDSSTINLDQAVADLETLRQHLHLARLNLYGHSWGSMLATAYIARFPTRVKLFISVGGGELDTRFTKVVNDNVRAATPAADTARAAYWRRPDVVAQDPVRAAYEQRKLKVARAIYDRSQLDRVMTQIEHAPRNGDMAALMWKSLANKLHLTTPIKGYSGKTLLVFGWNDMIGLTTVTQYLQAFPQAEWSGIINCGHYPEIEQPQQFYPLVTTFLDKNLAHLK